MTAGGIGRYRIRVSARARHARLRVCRHQGLEVIVPWGFDHGYVPDLIARHRLWIVRQLAALSAEPAELPTSIQLPALRQHWTVQWVAAAEGRGPRHDHHKRRLILPCDEPWTGAAHLQAWLSKQARHTLPAWLASVSATTGLNFQRVGIRLQRSRWGSCSARGNISLNARLLLLDPELVHHVMIHELCHTRVFNHSPAFWKLVAGHDPLWQQHRARLQIAARQTPWWIER